jgi:hypothetical protein
MEGVLVENNVLEGQWRVSPVSLAAKSGKKSFEEACAECNAVPLEIFINELKKRVKERYQNAKS